MFPDSAIAKKFGCARTKTTQILNGAMMPALQKYLVNYMKTQPFSLTNDGTSDTGVNKMNATCPCTTICGQLQVRTPQPLNHCFRKWMVH